MKASRYALLFSAASFFQGMEAVETRRPSSSWTDPISLGLDFLYLKVQENGLPYAVVYQDAPPPSSSGKIKNPDFDFSPGFRVYLGYDLKHDSWTLNLIFTHFHPKIIEHLKRKENTFLAPIWMLPKQICGTVDQANLRWRLHLGLLDLNLQKTCSFTSHLDLVPQIGFRSAWVRQKDRIHYQGGSLLMLNEEDEISRKDKFWGLGPRLGMGTLWKLPKRFSLYQETALSLLYGEVYVHQDEDLIHPKAPVLKILDVYHTLKAFLDLKLHLRWTYVFSNKHREICTYIGYEQYILFGQNQFIKFLNSKTAGALSSNLGDLTLQGWTLGINFHF